MWVSLPFDASTTSTSWRDMSTNDLSDCKVSARSGSSLLTMTMEIFTGRPAPGTRIHQRFYPAEEGTREEVGGHLIVDLAVGRSADVVPGRQNPRTLIDGGRRQVGMRCRRIRCAGPYAKFPELVGPDERAGTRLLHQPFGGRHFLVRHVTVVVRGSAILQEGTTSGAELCDQAGPAGGHGDPKDDQTHYGSRPR